MQPKPMILRVHDGELSQDWLIPLIPLDGPDIVFLDTVTRPSGPIELLEPGTCEVVATANPPRTGPGVLVSFWFDDFETERWALTARVDNLRFPPTTPRASGTYCRETT